MADDEDEPVVRELAERLSFAAMSVFDRVTYATAEKRFRGQPVGGFWIELAKDVLRAQTEGSAVESAEHSEEPGDKTN